MALFNTPTKNQLIKNAQEKIDTFVFMSVNVNNINSGWMTEVSLIAVQVNQLKSVQLEANPMPRICDKLTLTIDPCLPMEDHLCFLSKTNNKLVQEAMKKGFDNNVFKLIQLFLQRQFGQVCLLSHNGFRHDFQVLQLELDKLAMSVGLVNSDEVWCADSLWTYKEIDNRNNVGANTVWNTGASILDMFTYTLGSVYCRYLNKPMEIQQTAEERNLCLVELVCCTLDLFLKNICCKKFAFVNRAHRSCMPTSPAVNHSYVNHTVSEQMTQTYIFLDLETTGLVNPQITEFCMIAVHANSLKGSAKIKTPRVIDKLVAVVDPLTQIQQRASEITGLTNRSIENNHKLPFDSEFCFAIKHFICRQCGPVCLVSHNGAKFDFPIFRNSIQKLIDPSHLGQIFCADTLVGLKQLNQKEKGSNFNNRSFKPSFKLIDVYTRCCGDLMFSWHSAESDSLALMQITMCKPELLIWLDQNKVPFT
ncbi:uncharacterized protein LOC108949427 [Ciona intestinalis]